MGNFRFSLTHFFVVLTLVAIALGAIGSQSRIAMDTVFTLYWSLICLAIAGSVVVRGPTRAFWIAFAAFGLCYWWFAFETETSRPLPPGTTWRSAYNRGNIREFDRTRFITSDIIDFVETHITATKAVGNHVTAVWRNSSLYPGVIIDEQDGQYMIKWDDGSANQWTPSAQVFPDHTNVRVAAHCLLGGTMSLVGGVIALMLFGKVKDEKSPESK